MARQKKNKVFDLFKEEFKISFFYKPTFESNDEYYYIVLEDSIKLRIKLISDVVVIDMVVPCTKSYINPLYDKLIESIMNQNKVTVLVSTLLDTEVIHQTCISHGAPMVEDDRYITISKNMYERWKLQYVDINKYGFYILSVCENPEPIEPPIVKAKNIPKEPNNKPKPIVKQESRINIELQPIVNIIYNTYPNINIIETSPNNIKCELSEIDSFSIELVDNALYIKDILNNGESKINLIGVMTLINTFEKFTEYIQDVYLLSINNSSLYGICEAKQYELIREESKIPVNKIFKQVFYGYGTYKIIIRD